MTVLSYHPCFSADQNRLCAGRDPNAADLAAIKAADAVILPQGCRKELYDLARSNCLHVFPNFDARFNFPGKLGQIRMFQQTGTAHPRTSAFPTMESFQLQFGQTGRSIPFCFPFVFKFDWGGEGETVFLIKFPEAFRDVLQKAVRFEKSGQYGFLLQEFIPCRNRTLRVAVVGSRIDSYWRIQNHPERFLANLASGATIERHADSELQQSAIASVRRFVDISGINLAGFDLVFPENTRTKTPLFLEINYFFGRSGLGGSEKFYDILNAEILHWIEGIGLRFKQQTIDCTASDET